MINLVRFLYFVFGFFAGIIFYHFFKNMDAVDYLREDKIKGVFVTSDNCLIDALDFRVGGHVSVSSLGYKNVIASKFEISGDFIYLKNKEGDYSLRFLDEKTLQGEGLLNCTYHKK